MADELGRRLVAAIDDNLGTQPSFRAAHAKGACFDAVFKPTPEAAALCAAPHLAGPEVPAVVRFSNASPRPDAADWAQDVGGMAVKFLLPDGRETDIVAINMPMFLVREPEDFIAFTRARRPDPRSGRPSTARVLGYALRHPESWRGILFAARRQRTVMAGRGEARYFGIHALRWIAGSGAQTHVRYELAPDAPERELSRAEARDRGRDFLNSELTERLRQGPVGFTLEVQVAEPRDRTDDPTRPWPKTRRRVNVGRLEIRARTGDQDGGCERRVFDPTHLIEGIEPSDDRVLAARRDAYSVSIERRLAAGSEPSGRSGSA